MENRGDKVLQSCFLPHTECFVLWEQDQQDQQRQQQQQQQQQQPQEGWSDYVMSPGFFFKLLRFAYAYRNEG